MAGPPDALLVAAARAGDREAMGRLLERYRPAIVRLCARLLGDAHLAEDASQEAAILAWLHLDRLHRPEAFGAWMRGIARNVFRQWRADRRPEAQTLPALAGGVRVDPEELVEAAEQRRLVRLAVAALPPGQRAAVVLFYFEGLSHAEVARRLRTSVGGVKSRLHKGRIALRRRWPEVEGGRTMEPFVEMRVADVRRMREQDRSRQVVVLEEVGGLRRLPIWIGPAEATAIALSLERVAVPRPGPYQLALSLLGASGGRVVEARITRLVGDTYYGEVVVEGARGREAVDARPSDAINLALVAAVPVRVEASLLREQRATDVWSAYPESAAEIVQEVVANVQAHQRPQFP